MPQPEFDLPDDLELALRPVGVMRSPYRVHEGTPRQARRREAPDEPVEGRIVLRPGLQNLLQDLDGFSHAWVLFWFSYSRGWNHTVKPPRDTRFRGLFATRAPHRPNPIGLSALEVREVSGRVITVGAHDILDGSPILDIKPYVRYADALPDAVCGWVDELGEDAGPDHRDWKAEKGYPQ